MQRQLRDDKVNRINWERKDERDTESTHMQTDDDATTEGVVCVCIYTYIYIYAHKLTTGKYAINTAKNHMQVKKTHSCLGADTNIPV